MNDQHDTHDHMSDLRVPYIENMLTEEERSMFEKHLADCSRCALEFDEMKRWIGILDSNEEVLCPEPWELFDQWRGADKLPGGIESHSQHCPECAGDLCDFDKVPDRPMPESLWKKMSGQTAEYSPRGIRWAERVQRMLEDVAAVLFRPPALAAATVAAIGLALVFLYHPGTQKIVVGLGSSAWGPGYLEQNLMGGSEEQPSTDAGKRSLAILLLFDGFTQPPAGERIEELYEELKPVPEDRARFNFVSPAQVSKAVESNRIDTATMSRLIRGLKDALGVDLAVLITIRAEDGRFRVQGELTDTGTGKPSVTMEIREVTSERLPEAVRSAAAFAVGAR